MKRFLLQFIAFIIGLIVHFIYTNIDIYRATRKYGGAPFSDYLITYTDRFESLNGITIGLLLSFLLYIIHKYFETKNIKKIRKACIVPLIILLAPGFLLGCYGPLTILYIKKFGLFYEYFIGPIFLLLTIISTTVGYIKIRNTSKILDE